MISQVIGNSALKKKTRKFQICSFTFYFRLLKNLGKNGFLFYCTVKTSSHFKCIVIYNRYRNLGWLIRFLCRCWVRNILQYAKFQVNLILWKNRDLLSCYRVHSFIQLMDYTVSFFYCKNASVFNYQKLLQSSDTNFGVGRR